MICVRPGVPLSSFSFSAYRDRTAGRSRVTAGDVRSRQLLLPDMVHNSTLRFAAQELHPPGEIPAGSGILACEVRAHERNLLRDPAMRR